jgi:hypothetical protein
MLARKFLFARSALTCAPLKNIFVENFAARGVWQEKISKINTSAAAAQA